MKIRNIISLFIIFLLFCSPVFAFTKSTQHQMPYLVEGFTAYQFGSIDERIPNARIYIKNLRTGYTTYTLSNERGYFVFDLLNLQVNQPYEYPYQGGDEIEVYITNDNIHKFQIGGKDLCLYHGGEDCDKLASSQGGHHVDFNLGPEDFIYYEPLGKEITVSEWYDKFKSPIILISAMVLILAAAMVALYYRDKSKYRWMPGMAGILKWQLRNWVKAYNEGDEELANKLRRTLYKTASTITKKYIRSVKNGDIEPEV